MGFFSKIKHHVTNITKSAKQKAEEERERIEKEAKVTQEQTDKIVNKAKTKARGLVKKGKKKK